MRNTSTEISMAQWERLHTDTELNLNLADYYSYQLHNLGQLINPSELQFSLL